MRLATKFILFLFTAILLGTFSVLFYQSGSGSVSGSNTEWHLTEAQASSLEAYRKAEKAFDDKNYNQTLEYLDIALELIPKNVAAILFYSMMCSFLGEYDLAIVQLEKARAFLRAKGDHRSAAALESERETLIELREEKASPLIKLAPQK